MAVQTIIKHRRDTAATWLSVNPVLASGEIGLETDTGLKKIGNGTAAWDALAYEAVSRVVQAVKNSSGASIAKGSAVYISGSTGDNALVSLADADAESTSSKTLGLMETTVADGGFGNVITDGLISGVNTGTATAGQSVWLSSTAGQFVFGNPPAKPAHGVYLGVVIRAHSTQGEILIKVQNGYELNELHDVNAGSPSTGDALVWGGTAWVNQQVDVSGAIDTHNSDTTNVHGIADTSLLATKSYADNAAAAAAAAVVDGAPATLDTLNELAAALGDDANYAATITTALGNKQDKVSGVSDTEIGYLDGVTSAIQTQLNGKSATGHTHTISEITDYTPVDISGKQDVVSGVSSTEIGYLDGVTSAIQTQLDAKASTSHTQNASTIITTSTDKAANYTLTSGDKNTFIRSTGSAITITVPNVLSDGESVQFIQAGSGQITFAGSGVTLNSADAKLKTAKQFAGATVVKSGGAYYLIGNLG